MTVKMRKNFDYVSMSLFFGDISHSTIQRWFHVVLDFIYANGNLLQDLRRLSNNLVKIKLLEELHAATRANSRVYHVFMPVVQHYRLQNPQVLNPKLVVITWDSRHIPIPHSSNFTHQSCLYSSKIHGNAIVKLVGTGMDGIARYLFMFNASTSPSCNDEGVARYILEVESNQGE